MKHLQKDLEFTIRNVPNFPKPGNLFKDITPVLTDADLCFRIAKEFSQLLSDTKVNAIAGIESRGFFFGFLLAQRLNVPSHSNSKAW